MDLGLRTDNLDPVDVRVGARIRARRQELGLTQEKLADRLGVTFQQLQKYERGTNRVAASRLYHLTTVLKVEPAYFFDTPSAQGPKCASLAGERDPASEEDTLRLNDAFRRLKSQALKRAVVALIENIGMDAASAKP